MIGNDKERVRINLGLLMWEKPKYRQISLENKELPLFTKGHEQTFVRRIYLCDI